jgi:hypothetical protein
MGAGRRVEKSGLSSWSEINEYFAHIKTILGLTE